MTLPHDEFPRLTPDNHQVTSPATPDYNCVAWMIDIDGGAGYVIPVFLSYRSTEAVCRMVTAY